MPKSLTLPILETLDYLCENNLTIAHLWTEQPDTGLPQTHISTKTAQDTPKPTGTATISNVFEYQKALQNCTICHAPKTAPGHATCLSVKCLRSYLFGRK